MENQFKLYILRKILYHYLGKNLILNTGTSLIAALLTVSTVTQIKTHRKSTLVYYLSPLFTFYLF